MLHKSPGMRAPGGSGKLTRAAAPILNALGNPAAVGTVNLSESLAKGGNLAERTGGAAPKPKT